MPQPEPCARCTDNRSRAQTDIIRRDAVVRVVPYGCITMGQRGAGELVDFAALAPDVVGFSDDGRGVQSDELMEEAMRRAAKAGRPIVAHCEVDDLLRGGYIHDGEYCRAHGHKGICSESEWKQVERDIALAEKTGCQYHVCHVSTKESVELVRRAKARGVRVSCETAPHYLLLCDEDLHPMFDMFDMSSLRTGIMAGSLCPVELMKQVEEKMYMKVTSVYGLTETSPGMTASRIDDPFDVRCNTVGHDFEHTEVMVIDPETGEECPVGVQGEMCNRGYNNMKGYYKNPQATAEVIDKNGFLHSGDLGVKDEDGNYRITGRIKDMIIRGGENIYPREIEEFLYKLEGVKDVQVAGIPSKKYGEEVGAFIILKEGADIHESDVRDFCTGKISRYKIPKYVFFIDEFPMTGSGKIQKFKLKDVGLQLCKEQGIEII